MGDLTEQEVKKSDKCILTHEYNIYIYKIR